MPTQSAAFHVRARQYAQEGAGDLFIDGDSIFGGDIDPRGTAGMTEGGNQSRTLV